MENMNSGFELSPKETLKLMLDVWTGCLLTLGYDDPYDEEAPFTVTLDGFDKKIILHKPVRDLNHKDPEFHPKLGYTNTIRASYDDGQVSNILHVASDKAPHVLASQDGQLVQPTIETEEFIKYCLTSRLEEPANS